MADLLRRLPLVRAIAGVLPLLLALATVTAAAAHEVRPPIATLSAGPDGALTLDITLNLEAAIAGIGTDHADTALSPDAAVYDRLRTLPPDALRAAFAAFEAEFLERIGLAADGETVALTVTGVTVPAVGDTALARISAVALQGRAPGAGTVVWTADPRLGDSIIRIAGGEGEAVAAEFVLAGQSSHPLGLPGGAADGAVAGPGWMATALTYLQVGFVHIVPRGLDHILFVVGLFLLSARWRPLLWQVTAFTLAHTVTLGLGLAGVVSLSPAIVEPLIAASIVYVAVENLLTERLQAWRLPVVFAFGLLHGLGFAGVLSEIGTPPGAFALSLVSFNVGVELGQLTVIAACAVLFGWAARYPWYRRAVVMPLSLAIAAVALYWTLERTGLV